MNPNELKAAALAHARALLEREWAPARFSVEARARGSRVGPARGRLVLRQAVSVWERVGWAEVTADQARFPAACDDAAPAAETWPGALAERAADAQAAVEAALRAGQPAPLRAWTVAVRPGLRGAPERALVGLERRAPDGLVVVELDVQDGALVGYRCAPLLRGSRRSAALSRIAAVRRAQAALELPRAARLVRAALTDRAARGRLWHLRWSVEQDAAAGFVAASLNARTGQVYRWLRAVRARPAGELSARDAARAVALAADVRLGGGQVGEPVRGVAGGADAWLAAVRAPGGELYRATVDPRGRVRLARLDPCPSRWRGRPRRDAPPRRAPRPT